MCKHNWKLIHPGVWEDNYECEGCGTPFQVNHDAADSMLPVDGCGSSISPACSISTQTEATIITMFLAFIQTKGMWPCLLEIGESPKIVPADEVLKLKDGKNRVLEMIERIKLGDFS